VTVPTKAQVVRALRDLRDAVRDDQHGGDPTSSAKNLLAVLHEAEALLSRLPAPPKGRA